MKKFQYIQNQNTFVTCEDILDMACQLAYSSIGGFKTYHESRRLEMIVGEIELNNEKLERIKHNRYYREVEQMQRKCIQRQKSANESR